MKHPIALALAIALSGSMAACTDVGSDKNSSTPAQAHRDAVATDAGNPFFAESPLPLHYPQFDRIKDRDFAPAFDRGMAEQLKEVQAIAGNAEAPSFDNTIVALEKSGQILTRTSTVFFNLVGADTNDARKALQAEYAPKLAAHRDAISLDPRLFARIQQLFDTRDSLGLDAEGVRLIERYHTNFVRAGARLSDADKAQLKAINGELAKLGTQFSQNVLAEVNDSVVVVDTKEALAGLTDEQIGAAAAAAKAKGLDGKYVIALLNTTGQPPEAQLQNRALRQRLHQASIARGSRGNPYDNTAIVAQVLKLRAEKATMLGYPSYAAYVLADETAQTPEAVNAMLTQLAPPAVANAKREGAALQAMIDKEQAAKGEPTFALEPWDWAYYTEKLRAEKYDFDESQLKPYFEMKNVLENGVFHAAGQLYGLSFKQRTDLPVYHPDVLVYDVYDADGKQLAIFLADMYARPSKRGGAWMNAYVEQSALTGNLPVVANHLNITKPASGPTLLTWDEVTTMFHEFGHALHGMFSNVQYPYFAGTSVPRDFVEFPSQVNEMWADWPSVLANYARHYQTGTPMPKALLDKVLATVKFNQGFATTEYLGSAMLDQSWHQIGVDRIPEAGGVVAFEAAALKANGTDYAPVPPRYRTPYFSHIMGGYAAGYYAYLWSEVLDANTVEWIKANGGLTRANGDRFRATLLSRGGSKDALQLFRDFTGQEPKIEPLLKRRGLDGAVD
ncbi:MULTISPECIES: M3 family metallopeptidase [Rhodanobacter]|uniref:M3 family metallopeptidase n=1 Tax=Rhodanobacter TaxID=75309 RepID=UPI0003FECE61|nr:MULTISPECIES: M3 family metallopeptidase [Rhodanobacter]UJJ51530.1 M3 family metallopeptidase [Rhodanobacter denitrificans]UJJ59689.1 M3 family metallopeptidase [Rhodanobacter denitrificans]UJM94275.1 M3 family metallopeptidase [Rhodanobacter denitrificans]UJM97804.1 M3 family metallopeptidase [Rhodanobacter denitrificans]UJN22781.1 M3 family metallopeptidase [Rhodanobacter denitrificans]